MFCFKLYIHGILTYISEFYICIYMCVCVCVCIYIYICMYVYIYIYAEMLSHV